MEKLQKRLFWVAGTGLLLVGVFGWYARLVDGHADANYSSVIPWGLWIAVYIYFIGLSAGAFLISSLVYVFRVKRFESIGRVALFTALVTLFLALLSVWADLGHMERFWHVFVYPNFRSPMAWMIWLYAAYFALVAAELWLVVRGDLVAGGAGSGGRARLYRLLALGSKDNSPERAQRDRRLVRALALTGIPLAIMFHGGVGALFGVVAARPAWNSGIFPILFLVSALASGAALLTLVSAVFQDGWKRNRQTLEALGHIVLGLLVLDLLFQASEFLVAAYGQVPGHIEGLKLIVSGPYWWVFWGWQLVLGTVIPIVLLSTRTRHNPPLGGNRVAAGGGRFHWFAPQHRHPGPCRRGDPGLLRRNRLAPVQHQLLPKRDGMGVDGRDRRPRPAAVRPRREVSTERQAGGRLAFTP